LVIRLVTQVGSVLAAVSLLAACSSDRRAEPEAVPTPTTATAESTTTAPTTEPSPRSTGMIRVGDIVYDLVVRCYAAGAGEVLAIGVGTAPDTGEPVEAYVQAYLGSPYVGLRVGTGEDALMESSLEGSLDLYLHDDRILASAIRFVRGLDLATGAGEPAGVGQIEIECRHYEDELPA
jgi:hypothetical protein